MSAEQYITASEMAEVQRLRRCLDGLKKIAPEGFKLFDMNGEEVGTVTAVDAGVWALTYPDPDPAERSS